jgi:hypothetical protein
MERPKIMTRSVRIGSARTLALYSHNGKKPGSFPLTHKLQIEAGTVQVLGKNSGNKIGITECS